MSVTPNTPPAAIAQNARQQQQKGEAQRERPAQFGGPRLKLDVPQGIPGMHLYWANDDNAEIEMLLDEGFDFVTPDEVNMQSKTRGRVVADEDINNRVSKYVGVKEDGSPLRAYLLKCPEEMWENRQQYAQNRANTWDNAIRSGKIEYDKNDNRYVPAGHEIKLNT